MHELQFADAVRPVRTVVLNLALRPYSIGHEILLLRERNAFVLAGDPSEDQARFALVQAVNICSQTWSENLFTPRTWWERRRSRRIWSKWEHSWTGVDWRAEIEKFRDYLKRGASFPPIERGDVSGRDPGSPFEAGLIQFLIAYLRLSESQCYDYPVGLAKFHYYTRAEAVGAVKVLNLQEAEFDKHCREQDERAAHEAGFNSAEEHFEALLAQARASVKATQQPTNPS